MEAVSWNGRGGGGDRDPRVIHHRPVDSLCQPGPETPDPSEGTNLTSRKMSIAPNVDRGPAPSPW
ncbi:unnamed protein product [Tetraodon nigroviridis]|uniref:(spotted green pufferfish) hypothetical protein n=1 Tax=Tetraodon nigroviridis TaxID=99883 RepID=Q4SBD8_TETNG|nr:unnamed protein product [Tetraodon nigroviridis]